MKKLAVLILTLLIIPSVFAAIDGVETKTHTAVLQTQFINQGLTFAKIQGINFNEGPVDVLKWKINADLGSSRAVCELQPISITPGPFETVVAATCQTRSGFATMYTKNTKVKVITNIKANTYSQPFYVERIGFETGPKLPTVFATGQSVVVQQASAGGSALFIAAMTGITVLALSIIIVSLKRK